MLLMGAANLPPVRRAKAQGATLLKTRLCGNYKPDHCTTEKCFSQDALGVSEVQQDTYTHEYSVYRACQQSLLVEGRYMYMLFKGAL